jgi:hypothetical protein
MTDEALGSQKFSGWRRKNGEPPLADVFRTIHVSRNGSRWRRALAFVGPGYLVAVGYMDPGNWATSIAGGAQFGYALLFVALLSNIMAIILQSLCSRLAVGAGRDLAQACRDAFPRSAAWVLWLFAEIAIIATDIAEVVGTAIGLNLLFGIPLERVHRAAAAAPGIPLDRGLHHHAAGGDLRVLLLPDRLGRSRLAGRHPGLRADRRDREESDDAVSGAGHHRGHRDAA